MYVCVCVCVCVCVYMCVCVFICVCVYVCVLDFAVSLSPGTAETSPKKLTLHPTLILPGVPAVFGDISVTQRAAVCVCVWERPAVTAGWPVFFHTLVYFVSTWGLSLFPTQTGVRDVWGGGGWGCSLDK